MKVFKFGGASVKDAQAVKNVARILSLYDGEKLGIVISAMGKTTNAMEKVIDAYWIKDEVLFQDLVEEIRQFHYEIMDVLFSDRESKVFDAVDQVLRDLGERFKEDRSGSYDFEYDQLVGFGELISTKIVSFFLIESGFSAKWMDARTLIQTNNIFREAEVDWEQTEHNFQSKFVPEFDGTDILVTQGFIGANSSSTTTLGREGSDFTAGIVAYCCNADNVTIWKDVPGMLNADPKWFDHTVKLDQISFREAIELSYYGASVIHPKTVKPLQNKRISLHVKSFLDPSAEGTVIQESTTSDHLVPSFIFKMNQVLFSISPKDFSFIVEKNLSDIFARLSKANAKINLMQNSALKFSILLDGDKVDSSQILEVFKDSYDVKFNEGLELVTIRHYDQATIDRVTEGKEILLQQKTRETARLIVKQK
ncbi:MAG: aspartate kinase [Crocinitomicaceae bacterium]|nr:aspartate kinase [Crocinitomicaceae bacterium]